MYSFAKGDKGGIRGDNIPGPGEYDGDISKVMISFLYYN